MNVEEMVDFAQEYESRLRRAISQRDEEMQRRHTAEGNLIAERRNADALAEVVRLTMPDSEVLRAHDAERNPPRYWQVAVPPGGSAKVFDAEGNEV